MEILIRKFIALPEAKTTKTLPSQQPSANGFLHISRPTSMPASIPLIPLAHDRPSPATSSSHPVASSSLLPTTASSQPNTAPALPLSAKARGKQRENPFLPQPSFSSNSPQGKDRPASRQLTIRFTSEGAADLALVLEPGETIRQLRARVRLSPNHSSRIYRPGLS
jgi:hypothetical protein